jgi:two-component system cell cycle response regulator
MREQAENLGARSGLLTVATVALVIHAAHALLGFGGPDTDLALGDLLYSALVLAGAAACLLRAAHTKLDRPAWLWLGVGLGLWGLGAGLSASNQGGFPSPADAFALLSYPALCAALVLFVHGRVEKVQASLVLDGAIGALAAAAFGATINFGATRGASHAGVIESAAQLTYPIGDLLVAGAVVAAFALTGWRPGRAWIFAGVGIIAAALGDLAHTHQAGAGINPEGTALASVAPAAALLVCYGAFEPSDPNERFRRVYWRILVIPMGFAALAAGVLVYDQFRGVGALGFSFAMIALVAATIRPTLGFRENIRVLTTSQREALTDSLTGLGNRRKLMVDLREHIQAADASPARILILFDLDGFKQYNDTFGHPAGDALLAGLGANLKKSVGPYGGVYRMGGDEFCVLLKVGMSSARTLTSIAAAALSERGEGFSIRPSYGAVMLPQEARDPALALKIADQRMYAQKEKRRPSTGRQTRDILLQVLRERDPELSDHMSAVGELSRRVGQRLKLLPEELDETVRAAELHDIGKMAIPDAILHKPGPLDEREWEFVHKHTIIGERILGAAPALIPVAKVVRSSHERWDGNGYPDGVAGETIPIGARIVAVCDAFHAMTTARPYGTTLSVEEGLAELRKGAGTEFDPKVVEALAAVVADSHARAEPPRPERTGAAPR